MKGIAYLACAIAAGLACAPSSKVVPQSGTLFSPSDDSNETAEAKRLYTVVLPRTSGDSTSVAIAERRRRAVDSLVAVDLSAFVYAAGLPGGGLQIVPKPGDASDSAENIFAVLRDDGGHVVYAAEAPVSESGDWSIQSSHYFDTTGATVVIERRASFFNGCTLAKSDSTIGIREIVTSYFAPRHRLVKRTFVRTTFNDSTPAPTANCNESFQTAYPIYPTWDSLAAATGLDVALQRAHD
jgi:hypothetical protein